jgi:ATP-dependent Zn protease
MNAERIAYHEAGHCVACSVYHMPVVAVHATPNSGRTAGRNPHLSRRDAVEALVVTSLAGAAAEDLFFGWSDVASDRDDRRMARRYLKSFYDVDEIRPQMNRMRDIAERLVTVERAKIEIVADALLRYGSLNGDEVSELIDHDCLCPQRR